LFPIDLLSVVRRTFHAHKHELFGTSETADGKHYIDIETFCLLFLQ